MFCGFVYSKLYVIYLVLSLLRFIAHIGLAVQKYSYFFILSIFGLKISKIKNVNHWRVLITSVLLPWRLRGGSSAACKSEKRGPRGAQSGVRGGGSRAEEKKSVVGRQGVAQFCKKKFCQSEKSSYFCTRFRKVTRAGMKEKDDLLAQLV